MKESEFAVKRDLLIERTAATLAVNLAEAEALLGERSQTSLRLNTLKATEWPEIEGARLRPLAWCADARVIDEGREAVVRSEAVQAGLLYVQNAASFLPVLALDPRPGEKILDMCTAPGGKASHIAALTNNQVALWVNDKSKSRLIKTRQNFERLGVAVAHTLMRDITELGWVLRDEQFDKILLDAPCSGEGEIDIDKPSDFTYWSRAQIKRLQSQQKKAVMQAWRLLKPGGTLVYSTCTIAPEENGAVIDYLLRKAPDAELQPIDIALPNRVAVVQEWQGKVFTADLAHCLQLAPSLDTEAFFVAKLHKTAAAKTNTTDEDTWYTKE